MIKLISTPAVSCIIFPVAPSASTPVPRLHLSTSLDYSTGKLFRTGVDGVYGLDAGRREYSAQAVRKNLRDIAAHQAAVTGVTAVAMQGNGNIGLNNWAIAYIESQDHATLIAPVGEVMHERIYPCFIASTEDGKDCYTIKDAIVFYDPPPDSSEDNTFTWAKLPDYVGPLVHRPDREMTNPDSVFLPIWKTSLTGAHISINQQRPDCPLDWSKTSVDFKKLDRTTSGLAGPNNVIDGINGKRLRIVPVKMETDGSFTLDAPIENVRFAFFGIPVMPLLNDDPIKSPMNPMLHYFYDLRHIFDLGLMEMPRTSTPPVNIEFYLFELALKQYTFAKAKRLLNASYTQARLCPLVINIAQLEAASRKDHACSEVIDLLVNIQIDASKVRNALTARGYREVTEPNLVKDWGEFWLQPADGHPDGVSEIVVLPQRNVYSYSFIGIVRDVKDEPHVILAVTGGHSGIRPGHSSGIFGTPLRSSFTLEESVSAIKKQLLGYEKLRVDWDPSNRIDLLLLDQGGDVHQWVGAGGLKTIVGSSEGRKQISAELILAIQ